MKRSIFVTVVMLAAALLPWTPAATAGADSGGNVFAVGGGVASFAGQTLHFAFSAHQNSPNPPTGYVTLTGLTTGGFFGSTDKIDGPVQCLAVSANLGNIVFTVKHTNNPTDFPARSSVILEVQDNNGNPNNAGPDLIGGVPAAAYPAGMAGICAGRLTASPLGSVIRGNIVVHDPVLGLLPCPSMTDNVTYRIDTSCNLYTNIGTPTSPIWTLMQ
jgi:hypothetical protein